jgi:phage terminase large subunit-like protein
MTAEAAIKFLETLKIPEGPLAGRKLRLAEFQKKFVRGALDPANMVACLSIGRGNSKTATSSALALAALMGKTVAQPKREILFAARNRDQAKIAFGYLVGFIESLPAAERKKFIIRRGQRLEVEYSGNGGGLARCIAADGKSILGGSPLLAILDERAAWHPEKGQALENGIISGLGKRNGKCLIISTSAPDDANAFSRWLDSPPPGTYVQEHRPPPGLPPDDVESLKIANPGAAQDPPIGASIDWLVAQARRAMAMGGSSLSAFRNLNRNERVSSEDRSVLVTVDEWLAAEVNDLPPREGPCILGIDLGLSRSMSASAYYWPETGRLECTATYPAAPSLADRGAADGVGDRYVQMKDRGELTVLGENTVPAGAWLAEVVKRLDGYPVAALCCDRYRQAEFQEAYQAAGLRCPVVWWGQGFKEGSESIQRFRKRLADGQIKVAPSLLLRSSMADSITLKDPASNEKLAKARSLGRIDPTAATLLAVAQGDRITAQPQRKARAPVWL